MKQNSLIDKLVVFGVQNPERLKLSEILHNKIPVSALEYHTLNPECTHESLSQIDYEMWAYPDGIKIYNQHHQILNDREPQFSFTASQDIILGDRTPGSEPLNSSNYPPDYLYSFVLTDYELNRTYCTCLSWNIKYFIANDTVDKSSAERRQVEYYSKAIPKCKLSTLKNNPLVLDPTVTLVYIPRSLIIFVEGRGCFQLQRKLLSHFYTSVIQTKRNSDLHDDSTFLWVHGHIINTLNELIIKNGYPNAEKIFNSLRKTAESQFHDRSRTRNPQKLYVRKKKLQQFYFGTFFVLIQNSKPTVLSENGSPLTMTLQNSTAYMLPDFYDPFAENPHLFPLSTSQLITLWKCLLLEKQIIVFGHSQYESILVCETLLYLLRPIKWENIYIPFLPFHLAHHVEAIGGYLIGMSHIHLNYMIKNFDLKTKVIVNLKDNTILEEEGTEMAELPDCIQAYLQTQVTAIFRAFEKDNQEFQKGSIRSYLAPFQSGEQKPAASTRAKQLYIKSMLQIQQVFFTSLVFLFNNFIPFVQSSLEGVITFNIAAYLRILDDYKHRQLMSEISKTMVFIRLCEYHLEESERCAWVQKTLGELFVYSHDILMIKYVKKAQPPCENREEYEQVRSWELEQLLNADNKYHQYNSYVFNKNLEDLLRLVKNVDLYFQEEFKKYQSYDTSTSHNNLGTPRKVKWKKVGEKDADDFYDEAMKMFKDEKIQRHLAKYLKYAELNFPERIRKVTTTSKSQQGWLDWLWGLVHPPRMSRKNKEIEKNSRLKRKETTISGILNRALDLRNLFKHVTTASVLIDSSEKEEKQEVVSAKKIIEFCEFKVDNPRASRAHSEGDPSKSK